MTDNKFPGNPTRSYRTRDTVRIVGELVDWVGHSPEKVKATRERLDELRRRGRRRSTTYGPAQAARQASSLAYRDQRRGQVLEQPAR